MAIFGAIVAIGLLIIVHEGGHYIVARWCKMRVDRFSVGFGPAIVKWRRGETDFVIAPIPFGGYVQIAGMNVAEEIDSTDELAYPNRPVWQRFLTIFAGPATNYLFAGLLAFGLYLFAGAPTGTIWYKVDSTAKGYDAHGKLEAGDRITKINGQIVYDVYDGKKRSALTKVIKDEMDAHGVPVDITVLRAGNEVVVPITPQRYVDPKMISMFKTVDELCGEPCYVFRLGIELDRQGDVERQPIGLAGSAGAALLFPVKQTRILVDTLYKIATGKVEGQLTGPVGITTAMKQQFRFGWIRVIEVLMLLNIYLGLFNLLPLPALDGGRLVFLGYEMATRRRPNPKIEATVHMVGIMALLLLMIFVTYKDIARLFS